MPELNEVIRDILQTNGIHAYCDSRDFVPNISDHKVSVGDIDSGHIEIVLNLPECIGESTALKHLREVMKIVLFNAERIGLNEWVAEIKGYTGYTSDYRVSYRIVLLCKFPE